MEDQQQNSTPTDANPQNNTPAAPAKVTTERKSGLAIAGLIIAIFSLVMSWVPILNNVFLFFALISLVFGIIGLVAIKKGKRVGQGLAISTIIISVVAFIMVIASQVFYSSVLNSVSESVNKSVDDFNGNNTDKLLAENVNVTIGQFVFDGGSSAEYTYDDTTKLPVTIKNKSNEKASFIVKIEAVDASGARIADDTIYVNDLNAGQSQTEDAFKYIDSSKLDALKTASFKVLSVSK